MSIHMDYGSVWIYPWSYTSDNEYNSEGTMMLIWLLLWRRNQNKIFNIVAIEAIFVFKEANIPLGPNKSPCVYNDT